MVVEAVPGVLGTAVVAVGVSSKNGFACVSVEQHVDVDSPSVAE
jgi:hypothetical protein